MNSDNQFTNFKIHTQYSICEGAVRIDDLSKHCKENKIGTVWAIDIVPPPSLLQNKKLDNDFWK